MPANIQDVVKRLTVVHTTPGAENAARRIRDVGSAMREASTSSVSYERAARGSDIANARGLAQMQAYARAVRESALAQRALAEARSFASGNMGTAVGLAGGYLGYVAAAAGIALLVSRAAAAVEAYRKFEDQQATLQAALRATDGAVGRSAEQIEALAREIGDLDAARGAAQALLTYERVHGEVFDSALRAAKDLSATGFGDLTASARALGEALSNPARGLDALERAGIRFGAQQKTLIVDMAETGRLGEAQRLILDRLRAAVGGAGAARDATLSGAYTGLSDALQRSSEQFGEQIVKGSNLVWVLEKLAGAVRFLNEIEAPGELARSLTFNPDYGRFRRQRDMSAQLRETQSIADFFQPIRQQQQAYETVIVAIEKERKAIQQTNVEREIERRQREAGLAAASEMGQSIAREVTENERLKKAKEDQAAADKAAEEAAKRAIEMSARRNLQARQSLETAQLEIDLVGKNIAQQTELRANLQARHQLEQDAARTRTAFDQAEYERIRAINAELAQRAQLRAMTELRSEIRFDRDTMFMSDGDRGIAQRMRQLYGDGWQAQMDGAIAQQMRFNEALRQTHQLASDFASSFISDLRQGVQLGDALGNAMSRLADRLIQMATDQAINMLFKNLSGILGGGGGSPMNILPPWMTGSANGNVFYAGNVIPFARGGIVDRPTIFPMARGMGLMGEAGPEAVMPLRRAPDGRLGVVAAGGAASAPAAPVTISLNIDARGAEKGSGEEIARTLRAFVETPQFRMRVVDAMRDARSRRAI